AGEIRKRLLKLNAEPHNNSEIEIDLIAGSYVPRFRRRPKELKRLVPVVWHLRASKRHPWVYYGAAVALVSLLGFGVLTMLAPSSALNQFWGAILKPNARLLICMGTRESREQTLLEAG